MFNELFSSLIKRVFLTRKITQCRGAHVKDNWKTSDCVWDPCTPAPCGRDNDSNFGAFCISRCLLVWLVNSIRYRVSETEASSGDRSASRASVLPLTCTVLCPIITRTRVNTDSSGGLYLLVWNILIKNLNFQILVLFFKSNVLHSNQRVVITVLGTCVVCQWVEECVGPRGLLTE